MTSTDLVKEADSVALDAFLITTNRQERYESPTGSRPVTTYAVDVCSKPTTSGGNIEESSTLKSYFERMKTPPKVYEEKISIAPGTEDKKEVIKKPGLTKQWGKLRTAVALSSALDPDRVLKQYEVLFEDFYCDIA